MTLLGRLALCAIALTLHPAGARSQTQPDQAPTLEQALGAEVDRFVAADRAAPPPPCRVLFVGSSSIVKWREAIAADMAPMPVIERGFGGSHIEYVNRWFDEIVAPYKPQAIVFYAGENDIDAGKSVARVLVDFDEFMVRKTKTLGKTPVYFISLKPSILRLAQFPMQSQVNDAIRIRAAKRSDLHYIDVVGPMLENGKPRDIFGPDGLHMTRDGYEIWTRIVRAALLPKTVAEARSCHHLENHE